MGHIGQTPQSVSALGGFRLQGKGALQAKKIMDDAKALEEAGAFSILLELVPDWHHRKSAELLHFQPGVRPARSRSAVIYHDAFGLYLRFNPRMAKVFADAGKVIQDGFQQYLREVTEPRFPEEENWFGMPDRSTMN